MGNLLKPKTENPHATILMGFVNAVHESSMSNPDSAGMMCQELERVRPYVDPGVGDFNHIYCAKSIKAFSACSFFRDAEPLFDQYKKHHRFVETGKKHGLQQKKKHTIIDPWPLKPKKKPTQRVFDLLNASNHNGCERYVEWNRAA